MKDGGLGDVEVDTKADANQCKRTSYGEMAVGEFVFSDLDQTPWQAYGLVIFWQHNIQFWGKFTDLRHMQPTVHIYFGNMGSKELTKLRPSSRSSCLLTWVVTVLQTISIRRRGSRRVKWHLHRRRWKWRRRSSIHFLLFLLLHFEY